MSHAITKFTFRGDELDVARLADGDVGVPVRRLCEVLGLDPEGQRQRLARAAENGARWAVACITQATGPDGKTYEMLVLPRRSIPMWAATVDASRVAEGVRAKLVAYQNEAAEVLAAAFCQPAPRAEFRPVGPGAGAVIDMETGRAVGPLPEDPTPTPRRFEVIGRFVDAMRFAVDAQDIQAAVIANGAIWRLTRLVGAPKALEAQKEDLEHDAASRMLAYIRSETAAGRAVHGAEKAVREVRINKLRGARAVRSLLAAGLIENRPFGRLPRYWAVADASGPKAGELQ